MDEEQLEQTMRRGLHGLAQGVETHGAERLLPGPRRHRRTPVLAAAAVALMAVAGLALSQTIGSEDAPAPQTQRPSTLPATTSEPSVFIPEGGWRTEYWQGLAVDVPGGWGYGGAPFRISRDAAPAACRPTAMVSAAGRRHRGLDTDAGYVGRPVMLTDACEGYQVGAEFTPAAPFVWLGAEIDPGVVEFEGGFVQETVAVLGTTVTVGSADAALRKAVLGSVRPQDLCAAKLDVSDTEWPATSSGSGMNVCVYRRPWEERRRGSADLVAALRLTAEAQEEYRVALAAPQREATVCFQVGSVETEWVVLERVDHEGRVADRDVVHLRPGCSGIDLRADHLDGRHDVGLRPTLVAPWATGPIPATVYGPSGGMGAMIDAFIGEVGPP